ncbi:MAG: MmgE/PrpD family protein, partial [Acidobacteriaceae bacterium]|nr:MmgE/PrpD family protein [Acidobacteriaceae bacterium]
MADHGLTQYVAQFISNTRWNDLPPELLQLGKKSILDGMGVALSGSVSEPGKIATGYVESLSITAGPATVIGSSLKTLPRFAAFANGIAIHADDFDDTQLAAARDRVYGLLTHPTAPVLSTALAIGEAQCASGQDLMLAYHIGVEVECKVAEA